MPFWSRKKDKEKKRLGPPGTSSPTSSPIHPPPAPALSRPATAHCPLCGIQVDPAYMDPHIDKCLQDHKKYEEDRQENEVNDTLPPGLSLGKPCPPDKVEEAVLWLMGRTPPGPASNTDLIRVVVQNFPGVLGDIVVVLLTMDDAQAQQWYAQYGLMPPREMHSPTAPPRPHDPWEFENAPMPAGLQECGLCSRFVPFDSWQEIQCPQRHAGCRPCLQQAVQASFQHARPPECPQCDYQLAFKEIQEILPFTDRASLEEMYSSIALQCSSVRRNQHWQTPPRATTYEDVITSPPQSHPQGEYEAEVLSQVLSSTSNFDSSKFLGRGRTADVYRGIVDSRIVAVKKLRVVDEGTVANYKREVELLKTMVGHPNIIDFISAPEYNAAPLMVMEYAPHGTLYDWLFGGGGQLPSWYQRLSSVADITLALQHLHTQYPPIIHRDVKTSNVYLKSSLQTMLGDFGAAHYSVAGQTRLPTGTQGYTDPNHSPDAVPTADLDIYGVGVVLFELFSGQKAQLTGSREQLPTRLLCQLGGQPIASLQDPRMQNQTRVSGVKCENVMPNGLCELWWNLALQCTAASPQRPTALHVSQQCRFLGKVVRALLGGGSEEGEAPPAQDVPPLCVVCCDNEAAHACWPCAHVIACDECLHLLEKDDVTCWICRSGVERTVRVV
eukprot:TRINITY_DN59422_c0_g1_i2.p1 TRINITY_DN59422_c0_g1~~TRINITY_DN59422_c0_g1_i2.p1  ORF type:complete len:668 (+),score=19.47 TRINITY_DN59422_c0_g1_i2:26-2029(+)